jgi:hypothetical protein
MVDRGCIARMLGGIDRRTLTVAARVAGCCGNGRHGPKRAHILAIEAPAPGVGWP